MHHGAFSRANGGGKGNGGVVADIAKLSVGREAYYTRELATDHEQYLSGHGRRPGPTTSNKCGWSIKEVRPLPAT
jgi:hypothetical protein